MTPEGRAPAATQRLFFALWPDEAARLALEAATDRAVRRCGGRPVPAANLHVTLMFLGSVASERLSEVQSLARAVAAACVQEQPLALTFDRLVHWSVPHILCALAQAPDAAGRLAAALKDVAAAAGFTPDLKPFRAHVTVARKVLHAAHLPALRPVAWHFADFALIDSRTEPSGPVYSVMESYPLVKSEKARE